MKNSYKVLIAVSLVVGLIALGLGAVALNHASVAPETQLAGVYNNNIVAAGASAGVDYGPLPVNVNWYGGKIGAKLNTAYYKNVSGMTQYANYTSVSTDGTASSSYKIFVYATTTAPRTLYDFTAPALNNTTNLLIKGYTIATSTTATTTTSDDTIGTNAGPSGGSTVQIPNNGYLIVQLQAANGVVCASQGSGICESATSTNRGFNIQWRTQINN